MRVLALLGMAGAARLRGAFARVIDLNRDFTQLRLIKSPEEVDWMRIGAWYSDRAIQAVADNLLPGITERDLGDLCQRAWVPLGGETVIHFFGSTPMDAPDCKVPRQLPSTRPIARGDEGTLRNHLAAIPSKLSQAYREMGNQTIPLALAKNGINDAKAKSMKALFEETPTPKTSGNQIE